ncbi:cobalamin B12-binding domain-containing protein [Streptomyces sp. NPDC057565]|uniref:cobalamin B12-binding domain-containing protein n=1 Tax=Streptomyces sp. NPDC057565 TaxID=3346169 RepID=UPI003694BB43
MIVSSLASDSHTWNLVFLQLLIEELGYDVVNLGACVPDELLLSETLRRRPLMVVISSINGHGYQDGMRVIGRLRGHPELRDVPVVIGGKLGVLGEASRRYVDDLLKAGFDAVFDDGVDNIALFRTFAASLSGRTGCESG